MHSTNLEEAYRRTTYLLHAPDGDIGIRIGELSPRLDHLLRTLGASEWAFITAWNPGSFRLPPEENERANRDLLERIVRMGYQGIPGEGIGDDGDWEPERSFFIPGISRQEALELGAFYRQRAVVVGRVGEAPELVWC